LKINHLATLTIGRKFAHSGHPVGEVVAAAKSSKTSRKLFEKKFVVGRIPPRRFEYAGRNGVYRLKEAVQGRIQ
jgi:hypothetical protein